MSTSGFLYRDILKYVIPTLLFLGLIVPLFENNVDSKMLFSFGIVISLLFGPLLSKLSTLFFEIFAKVRDVIRVTYWMNSNWNYRKMFYNIDKEDRDYLYLTGAYIEFFKNAGFVIFLFLIVILIQMSTELKDNFLSYITHSTVIFNIIRINTIFLSFICVILIGTLKKALISETKILLFPNGQYEIFAEKTQKRLNELLAKKIYGNITNHCKGLEIKLYHQGTYISKCSIDKCGYWSFDFKDEYINSKINLVILFNSCILGEYNIKINLNKPYYELTLSEIAISAIAHEM